MTLGGRSGLAEFFFFTHFLSAIKGESRLIGSSEPVVGLVGHYVVLPCVLQPAASVSERTVEWTRSDLSPSFVFVFRQGRSLYESQNPSFISRTYLFQQELKNGNMSLKLGELQLSDKGTYTCKLVSPELETSIQVLVVVGTFSEPKISQEGTEGSAAFLKCDAKSWYPKPEMEWRDSGGRIIHSHDHNHTEQDGLYSVYSRVKVSNTTDSSYTCTVRQQDIGQSRETTFTMSSKCVEEVASLNNSKSALTGWLIVFGIIILALTLLILMYWCGYRFQFMKKIRSEETDGLARGHLEMETNQRLREQVSHLQQQKERLETEVSRLNEEVEKWRRENQELRRPADCGQITAETEPRTPNSPCNQRSLLCGNNNPGDSD